MCYEKETLFIFKINALKDLPTYGYYKEVRGIQIHKSNPWPANTACSVNFKESQVMAPLVYPEIRKIPTTNSHKSLFIKV